MSQLSLSCLSLAARLSDLADATVGTGVVAFDAPERIAKRHQVFRTQQWPSDLLVAGTGGYAPPGLSDDPGDEAIIYQGARAIRPDRLLGYLLNRTEPVYDFLVDSISAHADGARLTSEDGRDVDADAVVIATGADMSALLAGYDWQLPLETTHGLVSQVPTNAAMSTLDRGVSFGGYLTPALAGRHDLGATFWRDPAMAVDAQAIADGHHHNLALLAGSALGAPFGMDATSFGARVSRRASLPDRRPVIGCPDLDIGRWLFVFGGLGARGFTLAPLLGDLLAADILGRPVPLPVPQWNGIQAARYSVAAG
jgi:tRNA 5-methylaminomethyl-2-thiouridine biosynthesis bifunctional protein